MRGVRVIINTYAGTVARVGGEIIRFHPDHWSKQFNFYTSVRRFFFLFRVRFPPPAVARGATLRRAITSQRNGRLITPFCSERPGNDEISVVFTARACPETFHAAYLRPARRPRPAVFVWCAPTRPVAARTALTLQGVASRRGPHDMTLPPRASVQSIILFSVAPVFGVVRLYYLSPTHPPWYTGTMAYLLGREVLGVLDPPRP